MGNEKMKLCECGCGSLVNNRFVSGHNSAGPQNPNWRGGTMKGGEKGAYRCTYAPNHPNAYQNHVLEHRLLAEKALGKSLPVKAVVHHHDPEQLVVCQDQAYHMLLHARGKAFISCGHANYKWCRYCKTYDDPLNLHIMPSGAAYHKTCQQKHYQESKRR
jgi:hypothetical protein